MSALVTPGRVITLLVIPPATVALVCGWWAIDQAAYAYRLCRAARRQTLTPIETRRSR